LNRVIAGLGLAVLVLLAVALVGLSIAGRPASEGLAEAPTTSTTEGPGTTTTVAASNVDAVVAEVQAFVASVRKRDFKKPVKVSLLDGQAFRDRLLADSEESRDDIERSQRALRALGLLSSEVDLYEVVQGFFGDAVVGFYDPEEDDLVVRAGRLTPYARGVLAHELTHALDDQWFDLDRPALDEPGNAEAATAFQALVEGNAVRVQDVYVSRLSAVERIEAEVEGQRAAASIDLQGVPEVLPEIVNWPYETGPSFVQALLRAGGEARVDAAYERPPTTTADIVDPAGFLAGRPSATVTIPDAEGTVLDSGIFGHASLVDTLEPVIGTEEAKLAADGWAGDAYVLWDAGRGRSCVRATFVMRSAVDLAQLTDALGDWADDRKATLTTGDGRVGFTRCG
jgi:hypothetical protein